MAQASGAGGRPGQADHFVRVLHAVVVAVEAAGVGSHSADAQPVPDLHIPRRRDVVRDDVVAGAGHAVEGGRLVLACLAELELRREFGVELVTGVLERQPFGLGLSEALVDGLVEVVVHSVALHLLADDPHQQVEGPGAEEPARFCDDFVPERVVVDISEAINDLVGELAGREATAYVHDGHLVAVLASDLHPPPGPLDRLRERDATQFLRTGIEVNALETDAQLSYLGHAFFYLFLGLNVVAELAEEIHQGLVLTCALQADPPQHPNMRGKLLNLFELRQGVGHGQPDAHLIGAHQVILAFDSVGVYHVSRADAEFILAQCHFVLGADVNAHPLAGQIIDQLLVMVGFHSVVGPHVPEAVLPHPEFPGQLRWIVYEVALSVAVFANELVNLQLLGLGQGLRVATFEEIDGKLVTCHLSILQCIIIIPVLSSRHICITMVKQEISFTAIRSAPAEIKQKNQDFIIFYQRVTQELIDFD